MTECRGDKRKVKMVSQLDFACGIKIRFFFFRREQFLLSAKKRN